MQISLSNFDFSNSHPMMSCLMKSSMILVSVAINICSWDALFLSLQGEILFRSDTNAHPKKKRSVLCICEPSFSTQGRKRESETGKSTWKEEQKFGLHVTHQSFDGLACVSETLKEKNNSSGRKRYPIYRRVICGWREGVVPDRRAGEATQSSFPYLLHWYRYQLHVRPCNSLMKSRGRARMEKEKGERGCMGLVRFFE